MSRLLIAALALSALGYLAYRAMYQAHDDAVVDAKARGEHVEQEVSAPAGRLQNVRNKAKDIEAQQEQYLQEADEKMQQ